MTQHNEKGTRRDLVLYRLEVAKSDIKSAKISFNPFCKSIKCGKPSYKDLNFCPIFIILISRGDLNNKNPVIRLINIV